MYICKFCNKCSEHLKYVEQHIRKAHANEFIWKCKYCNTLSSKKELLEKHMQNCAKAGKLKIKKKFI